MSMLFNMCMTMWKVSLALSSFIPAFIFAGKVDQHFSNFGQWMRIPEQNLADCTVMSNGFVIRLARKVYFFVILNSELP